MSEQVSLAQEYNQQGLVLYGVNKFDEAIAMYRKAEQEDPMYLKTYINMAEVYIMTDRYKEAKEELNKVLLIDKNNGEALFHLGNVEYLQDNIEEARSLFTKAISNGYDSPRASYHLACLYMDMMDLDNAIFYLNKTIKADPFNVEARLRKIDVLVYQEKYAEVLKNAELLVEARPDTFEGYHFKFVAYMGLEQIEEANKAVDYARELFPDDLGFVYDKIKCYEYAEDYEAALKLIDVSFEKGTNDWMIIRKEKSKILFSMKKYEECKTLLEEILSDSFDEEMCYVLMQLNAIFKEYDKVIDNCKRIIDNQNTNDEYYYSAVYYEACCYKKLGKTDEAIKKFEEAQKLFRIASTTYPGNMILYLYRALCYRELKQYSQAMEMVEYMMTVTDGSVAEAYFVRGQIYADMNEMEKAKEDTDKAMSMNKLIKDVFM